MGDNWTTCHRCGKRYNKKIGHRCQRRIYPPFDPTFGSLGKRTRGATKGGVRWIMIQDLLSK